MIETHLNLFDAAVIVVMLLSCALAFFRGFVREILSLGAWIGAGLVTIYYFPDVAKALQPHFKNPIVAAGVGTLGIYLTALMGFAIINRLILKFMKEGSDIGMLDNMFGLMFGAFRGAFIISLGFFLMTIVLPQDENEYPEWLKASMTRPYVAKGAVLLASVAPDYLREVSTLQERALQERDRRRKDVQESGYSPAAGRQLDRLLESTDDN